MIDPWDALLPGRNVASSRQDEWYQEIDKRYLCSLFATKRIFQPAPEGAVFLLHSGQCQASLRAGRLGDSSFRDIGGPGAVPHVGPFWWEACPDS